MIAVLSGLLYFLIFLFIYVGLVMLYVVVGDADNAGFLLLFSPCAAILGFVTGFRRSKSGQEGEDQE